jgi:hypothetical protein
MKKAGSGAGSESVSQRYGSPDPDPYKNVTDPQHATISTPLLFIKRLDHEIELKYFDKTG